ncbi:MULTISPECIES: GNAT family N-acetyltransferase [unclassified Bradyrhizobium]|uniref:GNAT family N-acetyltransferase n=1 Tax=unclassified Bradyrhizobium TaxID=2631580 RepID=UPI001FF775E4|nr:MULTISPECIES: GNAT family N-acetyltransferase [unclassified Bradyrhizobium]
MTSATVLLNGSSMEAPLTRQESEALAFLIPLSYDYPGIESWFRTKVVPGLRNESRILLRVERHGQLVGLAIGKREPEENKICTVRIAPSHYGRGIGVRLFDAVLRWLDDDKPHLTVSENRLPAFERIFDFYGFNLTSVQQGLYVPNTSEIVYNEHVTPQRYLGALIDPSSGYDALDKRF